MRFDPLKKASGEIGPTFHVELFKSGTLYPENMCLVECMLSKLKSVCFERFYPVAKSTFSTANITKTNSKSYQMKVNIASQC